MKKFTKKLLSFLLFFLMVFTVLNMLYLLVLAITDWDFRKRIEALRFENPGFELLVLGNSRAEYGVDTELLTSSGIKSYNLSLIGNSERTCYIQLNEYLSKHTVKPGYVFVVLNSTLDEIDRSGIQPIVEFTMAGHKYGINDIPVSKFRWFSVEVLKKMVSKRFRITEITYGQVKSLGRIPDNSDYKENYLDIKKYESSYWIGEIARLCIINGIEIKIVEIPAVKESQNLSDSGPYKLDFKNGYSTQLYNFNSRDFCSIIDPENDWGGLSHLNKSGSAKFTKVLLRLLNTEEVNE